MTETIAAVLKQLAEIQTDDRGIAGDILTAEQALRRALAKSRS